MTEPGWPDDWEQRKAGLECPMCRSIGKGDNDHTVAVADLEFTEVGLERRSRLPGYCVVVWKGGHVAEPTELAAHEAAGYWREVTTVAAAVQAEMRPMKLNLFTLGNWVPHLHTHVVPRYRDDPAPGGPIAWDAIFAEEATPDEDLQRIAAAIAARLSPGSS